MGLTIAEKEHWKSRITRKIDQAIEHLLATNNESGFLSRTQGEARKRAVQSLGLLDLETRYAEIKQQKEKLADEEKSVLKRMVAVIRKCPESDVQGYFHCVPSDVDKAIRIRQELHEKELLAEDELGRQILTFRNEKEELLDTVWLATSGKQIKELWHYMSELLGQAPTRLQADALRIEPSDES